MRARPTVWGMDAATHLDPDEVLAQILAGQPAMSADGHLAFPLSDGTMASVDEISADADPITAQLLEILDAHDLAGIGEADGDEYRPEAHDLAARLRACDRLGLDEERIAGLIAEVLRHWFAAEDGSLIVAFGLEDCRPAAAEVLAALSR